MTVLFADCRNYTGMVRESGAERVARLMDAFFRSTYDTVVQHDGIVDKFIGDACMALFNVPIRHADHVQRAIRAGMEVLRAVEGVNASSRGAPALKVGVSISTGFALAGRIGSNRPSDYTAVGDVVNVAARLQDYVGAGEILVTQQVYEAVSDSFPAAGRREYLLKGIEGPVPAYVLPPDTAAPPA